MGIIKGLSIKELDKVLDSRQSNSAESSKARWVKLEDGESVKIRFLQELDPNSPHYNDKLDVGIFAVEHTNPKDYRRKLVCSFEDEDRCWGCEQQRKDYKSGWKSRQRLYVNVLVDDGKNDPYVAILSQGVSGKTVTPTLREYAYETGSITNLWWRMKRTGTKTDTSYTLIPLPGKDDSEFDASGLELYKLEETAVRLLPYKDQEAFFNGEGGQEEPESTSSSVDW